MGEIATIPARRISVVQYEVSDIERMARAISASKLFGMSSPEQALALCLMHRRLWGTDWRFLSSFASEQEARDFITKHVAEMNKFPVFL